jgi:pimeloyl-ACP methyl ester carboxylesterase/predicted ester cyclase
VDALSPSRRVLVPDLPGYGATPPVSGRYDYEAVNRMIEEELRARGVTEAAVVGFSGGAYRAFGLAAAGNLRVTHLVSLGGFAGLDEPDKKGLRDTTALARTGFDFHPVWLQRMMSAGAPARFPHEAAEVMRWLDCVPMEILLAELDAVTEAPDFRPLLPKLRMPMVLRVGALDAAAPPRWSEEAARLAPSAILQIVDGCGHALLYEDRQGTVRAVCSALGVAPPAGVPGVAGTRAQLYRDAVDAVWNRRDLSAIDQVFSPDYVGHLTYYSRRGLEGIRELVAHINEAVADLYYDVEEVVEQGDMIAARWMLTGKHVGLLYGVQGFGQPIRARGMSFNRFRDGKICEGWMVWDTSQLLVESMQPPPPVAPDRMFE